MTKKYSNLLFQHGSLEAVADEYLSDTAILCLRKLPSFVQGEPQITHHREGSGGLEVELDMEDLNIKFSYAKDMAHILATVTIKDGSNFSMKESRANPVVIETFRIKTDESGVKLIAKVLNYLGSY